MKNLFALIGLIVLCTLSSCSKTDVSNSNKYPYTCTCRTITTGPGGTVISDVSTDLEITEGNCSDGNSSVSGNGVSITTTCN